MLASANPIFDHLASALADDLESESSPRAACARRRLARYRATRAVRPICFDSRLRVA